MITALPISITAIFHVGVILGLVAALAVLVFLRQIESAGEDIDRERGNKP